MIFCKGVTYIRRDIGLAPVVSCREGTARVYAPADLGTDNNHNGGEEKNEERRFGAAASDRIPVLLRADPFVLPTLC
jgi:hypothetical protein